MNTNIPMCISIPVSMVAAALFAGGAMAQQAPDTREAHLMRQAAKEVPRLSQQFDQLVANVEQIGTRLSNLEKGSSAEDLRAEISGLKAQIAELKREQESMRREIVAELSRKMAGLMAQRQPPPPPPPPAAGRGRASSPAASPKPHAPTPDGPYYEHVVEPGQTLSLIAKGYETTVAKIIAANPGLKPNALRPGQKIIVPAEEKK